MDTKKKQQEKQVFDLVYKGRKFTEVVPSESPDFLVRYTDVGPRFGIEITDFFESETSARLERIPDYTDELLDGNDFRHKVDRLGLNIDKVDILTEDNELKFKAIPAIISKMPSLTECAKNVGLIISRKADKLRDSCSNLSHVNLIVYDRTNLLSHLPTQNFFSAYFVSELRSAVSSSMFREIFFLTRMDHQLGYVPLKMLYMFSESFFFREIFLKSQLQSTLLLGVNEYELFASYLANSVTGTVLVRNNKEGTEVIYGDTGVLAKTRESTSLRMYSDRPFPNDCRSANPELATTILGRAFPAKMAEFKKANTFVSRLWFPVGEEGER